jgi:hypothetical protein
MYRGRGSWGHLHDIVNNGVVYMSSDSIVLVHKKCEELLYSSEVMHPSSIIVWCSMSWGTIPLEVLVHEFSSGDGDDGWLYRNTVPYESATIANASNEKDRRKGGFSSEMNVGAKWNSIGRME